MTDPSQFTGRRAAIRDCTAKLPLNGPNSLNAYHEAWGLPPCPQRTEQPVGSQEKPAAVQKPPPAASSHGLGDAVSSALSLVGITEERVSAWLGAPCGCGVRKAKLNALGEWAASFLTGNRTPPPIV